MSLPAIYTDPNAAREHLESLLWPDGPICPHCGAVNQATLLQGKSTRPGVYKCRGCEHPFSVTVGTLFEDSKVPLNKWVYAMHLYTASKKGFSAHQLHRTLKVSYKTAWFMAHRIREAMRPKDFTPMGGDGQVVEVDETVVGTLEGEGGKKAQRPQAHAPRRPRPQEDRSHAGGARRTGAQLPYPEHQYCADRSYSAHQTSAAKAR
jgi:transposase-like protein